MKKKPPAGYVVYVCEYLRDETLECARAFETLEAAMEFINKDHFGNYRFALFTLGERIPLETVQEDQPQPAKVTTKYIVKKGP